MSLKCYIFKKCKQANSSCLHYMLLALLIVLFITKTYCIFNDSNNHRISVLRENTERLNIGFEGSLKKILLLHYSAKDQQNYSHKEIVNLEIFDPEYDNITGNKIIPVKIHMKDELNHLISLESKINVNILLKELFDNIDNKVTILLLDRSHNVILANGSNNFLSNDEKLRVESVSLLDKALVIENSTFYYVKKLKNYPFTILGGYNNDYIYGQIFKESCKVLMFLLIMALVAVFLYKRMKLIN